ESHALGKRMRARAPVILATATCALQGFHFLPSRLIAASAERSPASHASPRWPAGSAGHPLGGEAAFGTGADLSARVISDGGTLRLSAEIVFRRARADGLAITDSGQSAATATCSTMLSPCGP